MKKPILIILILLFISTAVAYAAKPFDFRSSFWGDKRDDVLKAEEGELTPTSKEFGWPHSTIWFKAYSIYYMPTDVFYSFTKANQLVEAGYRFNIGMRNIKDAYQLVKDGLMHVYGQPKPDEINWENTKLEEMFTEKIILNFKRGKYQDATVWKTEDTYIVLFIENIHIPNMSEKKQQILVRYTSLALLDTLLQEQVKEKTQEQIDKELKEKAENFF